MSETFTLQILHHADFEGNTNAIADAPRLAALFDYFDNEYVGNTLKLSGGDNWIPSPWYNSQGASQTALVVALQEAYETLFGLRAGTLSGLTMSPGYLDQAILNIIGIQASTLGNHDFDQRDTVLADIIQMSVDGDLSAASAANITNIGTLFPYITANLDFSGSEALAQSYADVAQAIEDITVSIAGNTALDTSTDIAALVNQDRIAPSTVVQVDGELIGIVGATTQRLAAISSPGGVSVIGATDDDMALLAQQIQAEVDALLAANPGMNKVILISHLQDYRNEAALAELLSGVDIILSAGSDAIFADQTDVLRDGHIANESVYPLVHTGADGNPVLQLNTDGQYQYLGRLVVEFDTDGVVLPDSVDANESGAFAATDAMLSTLYGSADPYAEGSIGALVRLLADAVNGIIGEKIANVAGYTDVYLNGVRGSVRNEETNLGNLSADANLVAARQYIEDNLPEQQDVLLVSLKNGGGIRSDIGLGLGVSGPEAPTGGAVTQLDIETALAFNNGIALVETTAAGLLALLEHGIANAGTGNGRFPQVGGLSFSYDPSAAEGNKLISLSIDGTDGSPSTAIVANGELVIDPDVRVNIATLNFLALNDGDGYPFSVVANSITDLVTVEDPSFSTPYTEQNALYQYLQNNHGALTDAFDGVDSGANLDTRIQNLSVRQDSVFNDKLSGDTTALLVGGGYGFDTVMFDGNLSDYLIVRDHAITTVRAVSNPNDSTSWFNVEALEFADTTYTIEYDAPTDQIATIYDRLLARQADLEGFQYWASTNSQGAGIGSIALSILSSQEYADLSDSNFAALDPTAQVDVLYQALLGRQADADGKAYWLNALSDGATLDEVAAGFVLSAELSQHYVGPEAWGFLA